MKRKHTKAEVARYVDRLALLKSRITAFADEHDVLVDVLKANGGGESKKWRAKLVKIPAHVKHISAHKQLRLEARS